MRASGLRDLFGRAWASNRPLAVVGAAMLLVLSVALAGLLLDARVITGAPAWLKPMKFAISISIYCFTLLWLLTFVRGHPRLVGLISWVTAVALFVEMLLIAGAAALGTTSHFNVSTPLRAAVWSTMTAFVALILAMNLLAALLLLIQRMPDAAFAWALRLGLLVSLVGMAVAFQMTQETPHQERAADKAGIDEAPIQGAHAVGVEDGGPGLPVTGWSTTGGDLRVPHFIGLHGLQALPLFGYVLVLFAPGWLRTRHRVALVWTFGISYLGLIGILTWQALRGQPLISPDARTLGALLALLLAAGAAASVIVLLAHRGRDRAGPRRQNGDQATNAGPTGGSVIRTNGEGGRVMIRDVPLTGIYVRDQEAALDFYTNKLGLRLIQDEPYGESARWITVSPLQAGVRIALKKAEKEHEKAMVGRSDGAPVLTLGTDDVRSAYKTLQERGVCFLGEPYRYPWGLAAILLDQDGSPVLLQQEER